MIKPASFAGSFYPQDKETLKVDISRYLELAEEKVKKIKIPESSNGKKKQLKALIVPHAGYIYSGEIAGVGYKLLEGSDVENFIVIGPSHQEYFRGIACGNFDGWETPLGQIKTDNSKINGIQGIVVNKLALSREHSVEVQLPFIQTVSPNSSIAGLVTGDISDYEIYIKQLSKPYEKTVFVISSDLSHYQPYDDAVAMDKITISEILEYNQVLHEQACGADGINILTGIAKNLGLMPVLLDYRNSGDTQGQKDAVVGYCSIAYFA